MITTSELFLFIAHKLEGIGQPEGDKAGDTIYGITKKYYPEYYNLLKHEPTDSNIIYVYNNLYDKFGCDNLYAPLNFYFFDTCLHTGHKTASKILQRAINRYNAKIKVDGIIGKITLKYVRTYEDYNLTAVFNAERIHFYTHSSQRQFRCGWVNRVIKLVRFIETGKWFTEV